MLQGLVFHLVQGLVRVLLLAWSRACFRVWSRSCCWAWSRARSDGLAGQLSGPLESDAKFLIKMH